MKKLNEKELNSVIAGVNLALFKVNFKPKDGKHEQDINTIKENIDRLISKGGLEWIDFIG